MSGEAPRDPWAGMITGSPPSPPPQTTDTRRPSVLTRTAMMGRPLSLSVIAWLLIGLLSSLSIGAALILEALDRVETIARREAQSISDASTAEAARKCEAVADDVERMQKALDRLWLDIEELKRRRR